MITPTEFLGLVPGKVIVDIDCNRWHVLHVEGSTIETKRVTLERAGNGIDLQEAIMVDGHILDPDRMTEIPGLSSDSSWISGKLFAFMT